MAPTTRIGPSNTNDPPYFWGQIESNVEDIAKLSKQVFAVFGYLMRCPLKRLELLCSQNTGQYEVQLDLGRSDG